MSLDSGHFPAGQFHEIKSLDGDSQLVREILIIRSRKDSIFRSAHVDTTVSFWGLNSVGLDSIIRHNNLIKITMPDIIDSRNV